MLAVPRAARGGARVALRQRRACENATRREVATATHARLANQAALRSGAAADAAAVAATSRRRRTISSTARQ